MCFPVILYGWSLKADQPKKEAAGLIISYNQSRRYIIFRFVMHVQNKWPASPNRQQWHMALAPPPGKAMNR